MSTGFASIEAMVRSNKYNIHGATRNGSHPAGFSSTQHEISCKCMRYSKMLMTVKYVFKDCSNQVNGNWVGTLFIIPGKFIIAY